eukprot:gene18926-24733_t
MGFNENDAKRALQRTNGDVSLAVGFLSGERDLNDNDAEFDLIAEADPEPSIHPPTVFVPRTERDQEDLFKQGSNTIAEMVDSRVQSLTSMGFTPEAAENALKLSNNDLNEALNLLLNSTSY